MELHKFFRLVLIFLVTVSIIALIVVEILFVYDKSHSYQVTRKITPQTQELITVSGTQTCLPHKNTKGPQTLECVIGLKSVTGSYYGLKDLPQSVLINNNLGNKTFAVHGLLTHSTNNKYATRGTIQVYSLVY